MFRKILIGISILIGIGLVAFIGWFLMIISAFGAFDQDYSITELKENFEKNKTEIYELKRYFNEIVPKGRFVEIEFDNDNTLFRFGIKDISSSSPMFLEWDLKTNTSRMDSIIKPIGWTRETLKTLKEKLDNADCIQIESGEPTKIGFKRSGMGMYSFNIFDQSIPENLKQQYNDSCSYIFANERLVLEYAGGAKGGQCFYNMK
ncbi:hypothetical protein [Psychroflexus sp. MES1-P1E]|uniref:hypothetical protein n=1 Tax=Psychroflexus sp. MES1-P1E TaxID=2058320 RepID=UPI000C799B31|nr:hypothetical protein [Psychroflexus sp. MES1-P1E]PKG42619.1 hypothetical protein CXF67_09320 [Psychroflexus sp. MES1-P1E]